jgi:hypothetical protein
MRLRHPNIRLCISSVDLTAGRPIAATERARPRTPQLAQPSAADQVAFPTTAGHNRSFAFNLGGQTLNCQRCKNAGSTADLSPHRNEVMSGFISVSVTPLRHADNSVQLAPGILIVQARIKHS